MVINAFVRRSDVPAVEMNAPDGTRLLNRFFVGQREHTTPDAPMGYLVTFPPHFGNRAHLHAQDQFQVFYPSRGALYKGKPIDSLILHYVDAFTVYGPFASGEEPLEFLTLRARHNELTAYMPEGRDRAAHRKTRHFTLSLPAEWESPAAGSVAVAELIAPEPDGLAAFLVEAGADAVVNLPESPGDSPRYTLVLDGSVAGVGGTGQMLRFEARRTGDATLVAGPQGVRMVTMHYPDPPTPMRES